MKTCQEWSIEFDRLYDNIMSNKAPGLEEYEKSLFLTQAQEAVVIGLYNGSLGDAFESTEAVSNYLAPLVSQKTYTDQATDTDLPRIAGNESYIYDMEDDLLFRTLELCTLNVSETCQDQQAAVIPVTQDEYWRTSRDPFKGPNSRKVLRLVYATGNKKDEEHEVNHFTELVSKYEIASYTVRYVRRPNPIILVDLENGLTIRGESDAMTCELDEAIHQMILSQAVQLAKAAWNN